VKEHTDTLMASINKLAVARDEAILTAWDAGWSYREIAPAAGLSASSVMRCVAAASLRRERETT